MGFLKIWLLSIKNIDFYKGLVMTNTLIPLPNSVLDKEIILSLHLDRRKKVLLSFFIIAIAPPCFHV